MRRDAGAAAVGRGPMLGPRAESGISAAEQVVDARAFLYSLSQSEARLWCFPKSPCQACILPPFILSHLKGFASHSRKINYF